MPFLNRSLPRLFIKAALSGLKPASESRFQRAYLHLNKQLQILSDLFVAHLDEAATRRKSLDSD